MADKEERYISITQMVAKENIETEKYRVMPREEAIKKISSHLLMCDISTMDTDEIAEAALNALLEGNNEGR